MRALFRGVVVQLRSAAVTPIALVTSYLTPLAIAVLAIAGFGRPRLDLITGAVTAAVMNALVVQSYFMIMEERHSGTMQMHAASPVGLLAPLVGRALGAFVQGIVALPLTVGLVLAIWGPRAVEQGLEHRSVILAFVALLMASSGLLAMAMVHVAMVVRSVSYAGLVNAVFPVAAVVMGFFTSISALPPPLRLLSYPFPPSWAMDAVRTNSYSSLLWCAATGLGWAVIGVYLLRRLPSWLRISPESYGQ